MTFEDLFKGIPGSADFVTNMPKIWPFSMWQDIYAPFGALHLVGLALMGVGAPPLTRSDIPRFVPTGSTSLRRVRTGQTAGKGCTSALAASSASHWRQASCRKAR